MNSIVFFAVGSPLIFEYEESCRRLNQAIAFGVKNLVGDVTCSEEVIIRKPHDLSPEDLAHPFLVPLFTPRNRQLALSEAERLGFQTPASLIDPTAIVASNSQLNPGSYVNAGTVIGAASEIGSHVVINRNCSIGHHNNLGDFVSIGPGCTMCGNVSIGRGALIGAGSVILPSVTIGANSIVGAGSLVAKDVPANTQIILKQNIIKTSLIDRHDR